MNIFNASKAAKIEMTKNERMTAVIKYLENLDENETKAVLGSLPMEGFLKNDIVNYFFEDAKKNEHIPIEKNKLSQIEYSTRKNTFKRSFLHIF